MADSAEGAAPPSAVSEPAPLPPSRNPLRRLYRWILSWAHHPMGTWALALFAFIDSSFFPIPPLFLQVALSIEKPRRAYWYAFVDTVASVAGAVLGFVIGYAFYETVGTWVIDTWGLRPKFEEAREWFAWNAFLFVLAYSFVPFPYKVITIGAGFFHASLPILLGASLIGRGLRFFLLAFICYRWGPRAKVFIEKYFNLVCLGIALFVGAIVVVMVVFTRH